MRATDSDLNYVPSGTRQIYEGIIAGADSVHTGVRGVVAEWSGRKIDDVNMEMLEGVMEGKSVLEVGCGLGRLSTRLAEKAGRVLSFDILDCNVRYARDRVPEGMGIFQGNAYRIPFRNGTFDVVVASEVLEHLPYLELAMAEIRRVLKKDGYLAVSVPNTLMFLYPSSLVVSAYGFLRHPKRYLGILRREADASDGMYDRPFLPWTLRRLMKGYGFEILIHRTAMYHFWHFPYDRMIMRADGRWTATLVRWFIAITDHLLDNGYPVIRWWGTRQFILGRLR